MSADNLKPGLNIEFVYNERRRFGRIEKTGVGPNGLYILVKSGEDVQTFLANKVYDLKVVQGQAV